MAVLRWAFGRGHRAVAKTPTEPQGDCHGACFRREFYSAPEPSSSSASSQGKVWACSGCRTQNFQAADDICRQCGSKSPGLLAREQREERRRQMRQEKEEEARAERAKNGVLTQEDLRHAYEQGVEMQPFEGDAMDMNAYKPQRRLDPEATYAMIRQWAMNAGHTPEF
eukprot:gb/GFBE01063062.1/.p1 GENE.gb/GFBE01063062.1/~~gb/GFBE01063062.1/.p1  ORF type:complete len:168 (+),score=22.06 gb/GFBE01063062.1/:1-504(+)